MSIFRAQPLLSFKFRTGMIHKIFNDDLLPDDDIQEIIQSKYQDPYFQFNNSHENLLDTDSSIIEGLLDVEKTQAVDKQVRNMAAGIRGSILSRTIAAKLTTAQYDDVGGAHIKTTVAYPLPEKYVSTYRNVDPFAMDEKETVKITRQSREIMAQQGAEYLQYMYRLSGKYFRNEKAGFPIMNPTGISNESVGVYRAVLYVDLTQPQYSTYVTEMSKVYKNSGIEPFGDGGIGRHKQIPFYYLVVIHQPHDHKSEVTNIFIKFMEDLSQEYEMYIKPMFSRVAYTNEQPFSPLNVPGDFWTLRYIDKGFGDLSAKISIRSYVDLFPTLDPDQLVELWDRDFREPSFVFDDECVLVGKSMIDILRTSLSGFNSGNRSNTLKSVTDSTLRQIFSHSDIAACNMLNAKECVLPLAFWVREIFDHAAQRSQNLVTRSVVLFFVMSADRSIRSKLKEDADLIFSKDSGKEHFPADPYVAAVVFNIVIANCLSHFQKKVSWTADAFESHKHPNPWGALIEKANDVNGPRFAFPNYSGMRDVVQSLDLVLFSFIGGYISFCQDTELATLWRKIRVGLLRMTYQDTPEDREEFMKNANMHGFVEKLDDYRKGITTLKDDNNRNRMEIASYGAPNEPNSRMDRFGQGVSAALRDFDADEKMALEAMVHSPVKDHFGNGRKVLNHFAEQLYNIVEPLYKSTTKTHNTYRLVGLIDMLREIPNTTEGSAMAVDRNAAFDIAPEAVFLDLYDLLLDVASTPFIRKAKKFSTLSDADVVKNPIITSNHIERVDRLALAIASLQINIPLATIYTKFKAIAFAIGGSPLALKDRFTNTRSYEGLPLAFMLMILFSTALKSDIETEYNKFVATPPTDEAEMALFHVVSVLKSILESDNRFHKELRVAGWLGLAIVGAWEVKFDLTNPKTLTQVKIINLSALDVIDGKITKPNATLKIIKAGIADLNDTKTASPFITDVFTAHV